MKSGTVTLLAAFIGVSAPVLADEALPYGFRLPLPAGYRLSAAMPGLPDNLALQTYWLESQHRAEAAAPLAEVALGLKF